MSRKSATNKILNALDEHEKSDLRNLNKEQTFTKFVNLNMNSFKPSSLKIYKTRFNKSIEDFLNWVEDPTNFNSNTNNSSKITKTNKSNMKKVGNDHDNILSNTSTSSNNEVKTYSFPIPLRENIIVQLNNLPIDLTESEAKKIGDILAVLGNKK